MTRQGRYLGNAFAPFIPHGGCAKFASSTNLILLFEATEFVADMIIYRAVYTDNDNENGIPRYPRECKTVPKWSNRQVTICLLVDI